MAYITFDEVATQLTEDPTKIGADEQTFIEALIDACCRFVQNYCNRVIETTTITEYPETNGGKIILLKNYPVQSVTNLWIDTTGEFGSDTIVDTDDYFVDSNYGMIYYRNGTFPNAPYSVKVEYVAGWDIADVPEDLKQVTIELVLIKYDRIRKKEVDLMSKNFAGGSVALFRQDDLMPHHKTILRRYVAIN